MKKGWLVVTWDVVRFAVLFIISLIILQNAPQLMNESSWLYFWIGFVLQIGGFILLGRSIYDGIKSIIKYYNQIKEMIH
jgi:hypothetical protein